MKFNIVRSAALAAALLLQAAFSFAASQPVRAEAPKADASAASARAKKTPAARAEPVDINSASKAELMKLPGIGAADAGRIIGGRPYLSKAHLVTRGVISAEAYHGLKTKIFARQGKTPRPAG